MVDIYITFAEIKEQCVAIANRWSNTTLTGVYGVPRGGVYPALLVAELLNLPVLDEYQDGCLVIDDLVDSGHTARKFATDKFDAMFRKSTSPADIAPNASVVDGWLVFPWEANDLGGEEIIVRLLEFIGEDPQREGLVETPRRVLKAMRELTEGYAMSAEEVLSKKFNEVSEEMVVVTGIEFVSMCEHHMLPFTGVATVAYTPNGNVIGLSKLARLVEVYAKRLQVQERLTTQIAEAMWNNLAPLGCGVAITSHHSCMGMRGIKKQRAKMTTTQLFGTFKSPEVKDEFLSHHRHY